MIIEIEGHKIDIQEGETLQSAIRRLGLDSDSLRTRPLAARFAGETFTLGYRPVRRDSEERELRSMRWAVKASNGKIGLIRYEDSRGKAVYERTLLFVFLLAVRNLFPEAHAHVDYAVAEGLYITVTKDPAITEEDAEALRKECRRIVNEDYPLKRIRMDVDEAVERFRQDGQMDKVRLLEWRMFSYFDVYRHDDYMDYFYGEMAPSTGYANVFDLKKIENGVALLFPDREDPDRPARYKDLPLLNSGFKKGAKWGETLGCSVAADLNDLVRTGKIREVVRVSEAFHEREFGRIASRIVEQGAKAVMLAGPSSSGKTTSANRLSVQLRTLGKIPAMISLDDYYIDRDKIEKEPDGSVDLEHIKCLDIDLFKQNLKDLIAGKEVELPRFDFVSQKRVMDGTRKMKLEDKSILIIEGLHALNPMMHPEGVSREKIFKLYVSALTTLNLDDHNRIKTTDIRLLRRIVRDYETRGASIEQTISMWNSVRAGEERWIFPYQEEADDIFNSTTAYEPAVLRKHIYPLLMRVRPDSEYYEEVHGIVKFLNYFLEADVEKEIPPTAIIREFIGGNTFYE